MDGYWGLLLLNTASYSTSQSSIIQNEWKRGRIQKADGRLCHHPVHPLEHSYQQNKGRIVDFIQIEDNVKNSFCYGSRRSGGCGVEITLCSPRQLTRH